MKLLITGGTGFIGSRLALAARTRGIDVTVTGQINTAAEKARQAELEKQGVSIQTGALQDPAHSAAMVRGCDVVVHLAAAQHEANVPDSYFETVNVGATRVLLEASRAAAVRRLVYGSTIGVYGAAAGHALDENSPLRPTNIYGRTKLAAEREVRAFAASLPVTIVRIAETYGPADFRLLKLFRAIAGRRLLMIGDGANLHQLIHVNDLVRALILATESPQAVGETMILAGQEVMTTQRMVGEIASAMSRTIPSMHVPMWPMLAMAMAMEAVLKPLGLQPPLHRRRLDFFRKSFVFDTARAQALLGFVPSIAFREGAAETADWYRRNGYLPA